MKQKISDGSLVDIDYCECFDIACSIDGSDKVTCKDPMLLRSVDLTNCSSLVISVLKCLVNRLKNDLLSKEHDEMFNEFVNQLLSLIAHAVGNETDSDVEDQILNLRNNDDVKSKFKNMIKASRVCRIDKGKCPNCGESKFIPYNFPYDDSVPTLTVCSQNLLLSCINCGSNVHCVGENEIVIADDKKVISILESMMNVSKPKPKKENDNIVKRTCVKCEYSGFVQKDADDESCIYVCPKCGATYSGFTNFKLVKKVSEILDEEFNDVIINYLDNFANYLDNYKL